MSMILGEKTINENINKVVVNQFEQQNYEEAVRTLQRAISEYSCLHPKYKEFDYKKILQKNNIDWGLESMSKADVASLKSGVVVALMIGAFRAERFNEGTLREFYDNGSIVRWLNRLQELNNEEFEKRKKQSSKLSIQLIDITKISVDCIVNSANYGLTDGDGVCGAIFRAAGSAELQKACAEYGGCPTGSAIITPGFKLPAKYIIHTVGPRWRGGQFREPELLAHCYKTSMRLAVNNDCHSIAFPLISSGFSAYPKDEAWRIALESVYNYQFIHDDYKLDVTFAVSTQDDLNLGNRVLEMLKNNKDR